MNRQTVLRQIIPKMLSTQLLAADVYGTYLLYAQGNERDIWMQMLTEELSHVRFMRMMMEEDNLPPVGMPEPSLDAFRKLCDQARMYASHSPFERTLWALRLEHAEIDHGLEALTSSMVSDWSDTPVCPSPMREHYMRLIAWARRYEAAREISMQIVRLEEHLPLIPQEGDIL